MTATAVGLLVKKQCETGRYHIGRIVHVVSGDRVHITELGDGADWPDEGAGTYDWGIGAKVFRNVDKGTGVGEWQELDDPAVVAAIASLTTALDGKLDAPGAPQAVSLTLDDTVGVQLHATRPCILNVRGTGAPTLSATGTSTFTVQLLDGATASSPAPSTVIDDATGTFAGTLVLGLAETNTMPWKLGAGVIVPAGRYVRVIRSAGTAACAITAATKQVL